MRKIALPAVIIISSFIFIIRIFYLQVIDDSLKLKSENNAIKKIFDFPERGYIYDRNGKLLVANQPSYDIMVIPREIKNIDTTEVVKAKTEADRVKKEEEARLAAEVISVLFPDLTDWSILVSLLSFE
jgi:penicillin-binding protein 2